jgi:tight adherence protein B
MADTRSVVALIALLLVAAALLLWQGAAKAKSRRLAKDVLDRRIGTGPATSTPSTWRAPVLGPGGEETAASLAARLGGAPWMGTTASSAKPPARSRRLLPPLPARLQGIVSERAFTFFLGGTALFCLLAGLVGGFGAALGALVLILSVSTFALWLRMQRIHRRLVRQLPEFIDTMVRLITIGNSTQASFQMAIAPAPEPLHGYLDSAGSLVRAGMDLDRALNQVATQVRVEEMFLLSSILGLGVRYGGRADLLLERVGNFMRDREQAEHELIAMSAEVRLSAWILGILPMAVGAAIIMINPDYFLRMWSDATGRTLLFSSLGLQALGAFLLYRLARIE